MKIHKLEVIPFSLPLKSALAWGKHGQLSKAEHCLVRVTLENGLTGIAEAPPRPTIYGETINSIKAALFLLEPRLCELEITDTQGIKEILSSLPNNNCAKGALDMALWEARAAHLETPLIELLGGVKPQLETSFILGIAKPQTMLQEAREVIQAGVRVLKIKVGRNTEADLTVTHALKNEFGNTIKLYADSNETLEPEKAANALEQMRDAGILWVEEPLLVRQIKARAELKRLAILPIIADDSCFTPADLERELDFDTFDILNIKTARNGFTDSLEMIRTASSAGKHIMIGSQASTSTGIRHAAMLASRPEITHPNELAFYLKLETDITNTMPSLENGKISLETVMNIRLNETALEKARIPIV
jgi:L-Ala-D/L-Glu epimerase